MSSFCNTGVNKYYLRFLIWLGAAPPAGYEHLLSAEDEVPRSPRGSKIPVLILSFAALSCLWLMIKPISWLGPGGSTVEAPLYFPSVQQIFHYHGALILVGPLSLAGGIYLLVIWRQRTYEYPESQIFFLIPILLMLGGGSVLVVYPLLVEDLLFRFDVTQLEEIEIQRVDGEDECAPLVINDKKFIREGFQRLKSAEMLVLSHEGLSGEGGYRIRLRFESFTLHYRYLSAYRTSSHGRQVDAIILHNFPYNPGFEGYQSSAFHTWLIQNIDPRFRECQPEGRRPTQIFPLGGSPSTSRSGES